MGTSGNPATRAASAAGVTSVSDFKKKNGGLLTLPSGAIVKVKNKGGIRGFVESGMIPNSLLPVIQRAINEGTTPDAEEIRGVLGFDAKGDDAFDMSAMDDMLAMTDRVCMAVVVSPVIQPVPTAEDLAAYNKGTRKADQLDDPEDLRDDDLLYIDELEDEDKMFIFQWVTGGTRDVERFRQELAAGVDGISSVPQLTGSAKRASRSRR